MLGSQTLVGSAMTTVGGVSIVILGMIVYKVRSPAAPVAVAVIFLLSTVCFMVLGYLLGAIVPKARAAQGVGLILFFVMMFLSGTAPPVEAMSEHNEFSLDGRMDWVESSTQSAFSSSCGLSAARPPTIRSSWRPICRPPTASRASC